MINDSQLTIKSIKARQIYDSRGKPTIEVDLYTTNMNNCSIPYRAAVPSGASTGVYEAHELRDNDPQIELGQSVHNAVKIVNETINSSLIGMNVKNQIEIDKKMLSLDGTSKLEKLGANSVLAVSLATAVASSSLQNIPLYQYLSQLSRDISCSSSCPSLPSSIEDKDKMMTRATSSQFPLSSLKLPVPAFNVINGGKHAGNLLAPQELMIIPNGSSFKECMKMASEIYQNLKIIIKKEFGVDAINVGDEGGFAPPISDIQEGLDLIVKAIDKSGYSGKVGIALDVAASEMYTNGKYDLDFKKVSKNKKEEKGEEIGGEKEEATKEKHRLLSGSELINLYLQLIKEYPIVSIEDPFDQDDWNSWSELTAKITINSSASSLPQVQIVGDDLTVTNPERIKMAIERKSCNCLLLKPNQIGTLTEAIRAANLACLSGGWKVMVSHRSGETEDTFIADLAVALEGATMIKAGAPCRGERICKYNRLLRIEEELEGKGVELAKLSILERIK